jgi:hypothetical protein
LKKSDARDDLVSELAKLDYGSGIDTSRLIGMIVGLAGEVFVMKARNECLRRALIESGTVDLDAVERQAGSEEMRAWFEAEERAFTQALLEPLVAGDRTINVAEQLRQR